MTLNFYNLIYLALMAMGFGVSLAKDGEPIERKYSFFRTVIVGLFELLILYNGGFFN
jgi:hypothetical protein